MFYSNELFSGKNRHFFGHMIHQIYVQYAQDYEYAIQKIVRLIPTPRVIDQNGN